MTEKVRSPAVDKTPDISPGEKLLDVIRGSSSRPDGQASPPPKPYWRGARAGLSALAFRPGKTGRDVTVGVEVGETLIRMVKLTRSGGKPRIVELASAVPPAPGPDAPELSLVLRLALKAFLGKAEADIWTMVPAEATEISFLTVPKMGRKQLSNAVYWTAKKEGAFDESDVVFDYEIQGDVMEKGAPRLAVMAYTVARAEFERLRNLFMQAGYPLAGVTLPSAACRNLFAAGWMPSGESPQACLHLGEESSRLEILAEGRLRLVRVLKGGLSGMAQALAESLADTARTAAARADDRRDAGAASPFFSSDIAVVLESMAAPAPASDSPASSRTDPARARELIDSLIEDDRTPPPQQGEQISPGEIADLLQPTWERLARQIEMTLKHFTITLGNDQPASLYICGPHGANPSLRNHLRAQLGLECLPLDPLGGENLSRLGAVMSERGLAERLECALTLGLTGARRDAFNLLHTYKDKEEQARVDGLNRLVVAGWLALAAVCLGIHGWQHVQAHGKRAELAGLQATLDSFKPRVDKTLLLSAQAQVRATVDNLRRYGGRTFAQAVLHDVCELTPENVRLFAVSLDLGNPGEQPKPPQADAAPPARPPAPGKDRPGLNTLTLEGFVKGDSQLLESILSAYLVRLRASPLMADVSVSRRNLEVSAQGEDVLRFALACAVRR